MNKIRIILAVVFAVIMVVLTAFVVHKWHELQCNWTSLVGAVAFYVLFVGAVWFTIDQTVKEANQK